MYTYCIDRIDKTGVSIQYITLIWIADDIDTLDLLKDHSLFKTDARNSNIAARDCQIYLDLNCNIKTRTATNYTNKEFYSSENNEKNESYRGVTNSIKIAEKYNLRGETQTNFSVGSSTIRRITIDIDGNISNAMLQIPMQATVSRHVTAISWTRKSDAEGVRIDTRNVPSGEWWMKLTGEEDSKYHVLVEGFVDERNDVDKLFSPSLQLNGNNKVSRRDRSNTKDNISQDDKETFNDKIMALHSERTADEQQNIDIPTTETLMRNKKTTRERSLKYLVQDEEANKQMKETSTENNLSIITPNTESMLVNFIEYVTLHIDKSPSTTSISSNEKFVEPMIPIEEQGKLRGRSSIGVIENVDADIETPIQKTVNISTRMIESLDNSELSEELVNYGSENIIEEKKILIEINKNSKLLVSPGRTHRIIFDVMNSCVLPVKYTYRVNSFPFRVYNVQPISTWVYPGQISNVAIDLEVPNSAVPDTTNTVTLSILGTKIKEKSVYLYVQGPLLELTDNVKPTMEYSFNDNCAGKLEKDRCYKSRWSIDITIQDYDSGLKRVMSSINNIYPRTEFISGTRSPVTFYYSATCCDKIVEITAIDLLNNYNTMTIDVTAWNNLSEAQIAAITMGALLALLLLIVIIVSIIYCIQRRKSHDFPYTQRYGSRPSTQPERTNV
ncbi:uncharacterized protein LOC122534016 isoform X2 [Frieseomelitta varia]|uniref:uncharacterized protein LOC122534016 isoform X2 n=1 Tax=Frieseomelitta varia TaxID=561572 RepID=UPI001CB69940|nr:uncharacterized protein LOC122534016 isoform X2 [Frieseomelitta varia]